MEHAATETQYSDFFFFFFKKSSLAGPENFYSSYHMTTPFYT